MAAVEMIKGSALGSSGRPSLEMEVTIPIMLVTAPERVVASISPRSFISVRLI